MNSVLEVAQDQLRNAVLLPLFDAIYSAEQIGRLKLAPEPYRFVVADRQTAPADEVLIGAQDWDVRGVRRCWASDRLRGPEGQGALVHGRRADGLWGGFRRDRVPVDGLTSTEVRLRGVVPR